MEYRIVVDSCGEIPEDLQKTGIFKSAPLSIDIDNYHIVDDETFDQADFLKRVAQSPNCPKSACPSPETYAKLYDCDAKRIYVITLSAQLSGSYNSARVAVKLFEEENGNEKQIHVIDSKSASIGETLIALKIAECEEAGYDYKKVIEIAEAYRDEINTYFVLESLEALRKNGRLSNLKAFVVSRLNIKPLMGSDDDGNIIQLGQARGMKKALAKLADELVKRTENTQDKILAISHCNNKSMAEFVKKLILEKTNFKSVVLLDTRGVSSLYASDGGIIVVA
ncbi:EDD domain protein, DegV family [Acetitomaculum ruminis DSM 5522]|uniref:EDD domain protein, DegV family n=1 Tax=Acetitomaculum ruminis DSM 5522 TaxID=1120918 RepID=A0A1I0YIJ7_9FIRM|nr:DegV family protein [Acetitomaculum ruminis]SFB12320.1 EDD domain protein, DegV family [Acetitomaculum ruminis DSM 5522]